ncbi:hypothetical protein [uncultured Polaribacter sp.]|uniref:hypothetical protein n=1 Tax=uncultured Polaribacter sp. TaxID=174711 RepID=UPI0026389F4D|nr:hypothetical protein [uncultured Polaribacter sp.]
MMSLHAFSNHEHGICTSKVEKHIHEKDTDCSLHLIKQSTPLLTQNTFQEIITIPCNTKALTTYSYLKNHYQLAFSLRGPPAIT